MEIQEKLISELFDIDGRCTHPLIRKYIESATKYSRDIENAKGEANLIVLECIHKFKPKAYSWGEIWADFYEKTDKPVENAKRQLFSYIRRSLLVLNKTNHIKEIPLDENKTYSTNSGTIPSKYTRFLREELPAHLSKAERLFLEKYLNGDSVGDRFYKSKMFAKVVKKGKELAKEMDLI